MKTPDGVQIAVGKTIQLVKALYGLRQSSRLWNQVLDAFLRSLGFERSRQDPCLYVRDPDGPDVMAIVIFVDDLIISGARDETIDKVKSAVSSRFKATDQGKLEWALGIRISYTENGGIMLSQRALAESILEKFGMSKCASMKTPYSMSHVLSLDSCPKTEEEIKHMERVPYRAAIGSLLYLANSTRPDISYSVGVAARYCANPGLAHWQGIVRIFKYIRGTIDIGIRYEAVAGQPKLVGFSDSDYAGDRDERKSTSGIRWSFLLGAGQLHGARLSNSALRYLQQKPSTLHCVTVYVRLFGCEGSFRIWDL